MATVTKQQHRPSDSNTDTYSFILILSGADDITDELTKAIYDGGCDDALLGMTEGQLFLDFDREATSLSEAIKSAIKDVESIPLGLKVTQVVPPGDRTIALFNAILTLRNDRPDVANVWPDIAAAFDSLFKAR